MLKFEISAKHVLKIQFIRWFLLYLFLRAGLFKIESSNFFIKVNDPFKMLFGPRKKNLLFPKLQLKSCPASMAKRT